MIAVQKSDGQKWAASQFRTSLISPEQAIESKCEVCQGGSETVRGSELLLSSLGTLGLWSCQITGVRLCVSNVSLALWNCSNAGDVTHGTANAPGVKRGSSPMRIELHRLGYEPF